MCENSGGTSQLCSLFQRPLPFSDRSAANYPTAAFAYSLNAAYLKIAGFDVDMNYRTDLSAIKATLPGSLRLRLLLSHQPTYRSQSISSDPVYNLAGAANSAFETTGPTEKTKITGSVGFSVGGFSIDVLERWKSGLKFSYQPTQIWTGTPIGSIAYTDLTLTQSVGRNGQFAFFATAENLFNRAPRIFTTYTGSLINFRIPVVNGDDVVGRYLTFGVRMHL